MYALEWPSRRQRKYTVLKLIKGYVDWNSRFMIVLSKLKRKMPQRECNYTGII